MHGPTQAGTAQVHWRVDDAALSGSCTGLRVGAYGAVALNAGAGPVGHDEPGISSYFVLIEAQAHHIVRCLSRCADLAPGIRIANCCRADSGRSALRKHQIGFAETR
jgi:hypothetical protein